MKSHISIVALALLGAFGCGGPRESTSSSGSPEQPEVTKPSAIANGTIAQNETVMDVKDAFAAWGMEDDVPSRQGENVLSVYFFPTLLSEDEKARMASKEPFTDPFFVTVDKASHDPARFQWYPHINLKITFEADKPRSSENITNVFLAIHKIEDTATYNIPLVSRSGSNMTPIIADGHETLETIFAKDGKLDMTFKGKARNFADNEFTWNVELKSQLVVE